MQTDNEDTMYLSSKEILQRNEHAIICVSLKDQLGRDLRYPFTLLAQETQLTNNDIKDIVWKGFHGIKNEAFGPIKFHGIAEYYGFEGM
jgi:hypothetical protein